MITQAEAEYVGEQKTALEYQIAQAQATGELGKIDIEREKTLSDINAIIGHNADIIALVNALYDAQADKVEETYAKQLGNQLFSIKNENELVNIEHQRTQALKELNDNGLDTKENIENVNALYDETKDKTLATAKADLEWRVKSNESMSDSEKIELQRQKEIAETNKKYGEQADLLALIKSYYDGLQIELKENTSYYDDMEESFKEAIGEESYKSLKTFQTAIVKTGKFLQSFSMIYDSLGSAISEYQSLQSNLREKEIEELEAQYEIERDLADDKIDDLEDEQDEKLDALEDMYDSDAISFEDYQKRKSDAELEFANKKKEANKIAIDAENRLISAKYEAEKKQFEIDKQSAIVNAIIAGAQGIMQAWALGPIAGMIGSAIIGTATVAQTAMISSQPAPSAPALIPYANGGVVTSPTAALIGEGGEPEAVIPLSKAQDYGFGGRGNGDTYNISGNTLLGVDGVDELIVMMEQRKKTLKQRNII
jgi:hypothetical protein